MSSEDRGNPCLFSAISGVIRLNGIPVENARVERIVDKSHSSGQISDETHTSEDGYFELPSIFEKTRLGKVLPTEFAVHQQIFVYHDNTKYEVWDAVKRKREENAESRGKPLVVDCELSADMLLKRVNWSPIFSRCQWDAEADPQIDIPPPVEDE